MGRRRMPPGNAGGHFILPATRRSLEELEHGLDMQREATALGDLTRYPRLFGHIADAAGRPGLA